MTTINQRLDLRQSQNLVMTPQLQQAIKLLQLNNAELAEYIESEIAQNPLLEKQSSESETDAPERAASEDRDNVQDDFDSAFTGNENEGTKAPMMDFDAGTAQINGFNAVDERDNSHRVYFRRVGGGY